MIRLYYFWSANFDHVPSCLFALYLMTQAYSVLSATDVSLHAGGRQSATMFSPMFLSGCHRISQTCTPKTVQAKNTQTVVAPQITTYFCRPWAWSISMPEITTNFCCCSRTEIGSDFLEYIANSTGIYLIDLQMRVLLGRRSARSRYASSCASVNWTFPPGTA